MHSQHYSRYEVSSKKQKYFSIMIIGDFWNKKQKNSFKLLFKNYLSDLFIVVSFF
jgi:hypothetical protein